MGNIGDKLDDDFNIEELDLAGVTDRADKSQRATREYKQLRAYGRHGVDEQSRRTFMLKATSATSEMSKEYLEAKTELFDDIKADEYPELPTFGSKCTFHTLGVLQLSQARRILLIMAVEHDSLRYCPQLPHIVEHCLHFVGEESAYAICHSMIKQSQHNNWYFRINYHDFSIHLKTMMDVFASNAPIVNRYCEANSLDVTPVIRRGLRTMYSELLSNEVFVRMVDVYFVEGYKILFRVGIALLRLCSDELCTASSVEEFEIIWKRQSNTLTVEEIFPEGYGVQLKRETFLSMDERHRRDTESEVPPHIPCVRRWPHFGEKYGIVSQIFTKSTCLQIWVWLPPGVHHGDLRMHFATYNDGYSLGTLLERCAEFENILLVFRCTDGSVIGIFFNRLGDPLERVRDPSMRFFILASPTLERRSYRPHDHMLDKIDENAQTYGFVYFDRTDGLSFGDGETNVISLDRDLNAGFSAGSPVFKCPQLAGDDVGQFQISALEMWSVDM